MRVSTLGALAIAVTFLAAPAQGQDGEITMGYFATVRSQDIPAFETAAKRHVEWHRRQGDTWTWNAWMSVTGTQGQYAYISGNHSWADFDTPGVSQANDAADWANGPGKFTVSEEAMMWMTLPWGSRPWGESIPAMVQVYEYAVVQGKAGDLEYVIRKFTEAAESTDWAGRYVWEQVLSSEQSPVYFVVIPHESWASFQPLETSPQGVLVEAYGQAEGQRLIDMFNASVDAIGSRIWQYRADLSYTP